MDFLTRVEAPFAWLTGTTDGTSSYVLTRWVLLRSLGAVYLIAFVSLWVQVKGLIGSQGILPAPQFLDFVRHYAGVERYRVVPTVFWIASSDAALKLVCAAGTVAACLLILNVAPVVCLIVLWILYLSLVSVGQDFLSFQWDVLLLEAGLLAILVAPGGLLPGRAVQAAVSPLIWVLLWWLVFRLSFQSGIVKWTWGDPVWRDLTALDYHFYTQPLPTWTAWYAQRLPELMKKSMVVTTYVLEIAAPLLIFGPRSLRLVACGAIVLMQLSIFATGNYTFFNLLTIVLALVLIDDQIWVHVLPDRVVHSLEVVAPAQPGVALAIRVLCTVVVLFVSSVKFWQGLTPRAEFSPALRRLVAWAEPLRSINSYGLFRVMTTSRHEIIIEGSSDGVTWKPYVFRYKPGDVGRRPRFVEPHQPRLDWQMWFAALSRPELVPWFQAFELRLLEGDRDVLRLLETNPFPAGPPRYLRAQLYDYRFTTPAERRETGAWWARTPIGEYGSMIDH